MKINKNRFYGSVGMMIGMIFMLTLGYSIFIFMYAYIRNVQQLDIFTYIIFYFFTFILPTFAFIYTCPRWFSVVEINEKGVKRSLFKAFCRREISWEEMAEIRLYSQVGAWLFFSKQCLENIYYDNIIKRKDVIQIVFSKKIYEVIREYTEREIINLPADFEKNE